MTPGWPFGNVIEAPDLVGRSVAEACQLAEDRGVASIRVLSVATGDPLGITMEHVPGRLNLLVRDGDVVLAGFF